MKKTLIAIAALAATSAFAQSTVTITGKFGTAYQKGLGSHSNVAVTDGDVNFAAVEDLGSGMKAGTTIGLRTRGREFVEGGNSSTASAANGFGAQEVGRDATVWMSGNFGKVTAGSIEFGNGITPLGWGGANVSLPKDLNNGGVLSGNTYGNILAYETPSFSGVTLSAVRADSVGKVGTGNKTDLSVNNDKGLSINQFGVAYANGPLAASFDSATFNDSSTNGNSVSDRKRTRMSASYDFGAVKVGFGQEDNKGTVYTSAFAAATLATYGGKQTTYGASVPVGSNLRVGYVYVKNTEAGVIAGAVANGTEAIKANGLAADYSLSKRTVLNVSTAKITRSGGAAYASGFNGATAAGTTIATGYQTGNQFRVRLMHSF